jgi:threonine/homoserine/homoserine lactone efflux protein
LNEIETVNSTFWAASPSWTNGLLMLVYLILGTTYGFAAAVMPGPLSTYLISQALTSGWRRTLPAAFTPLLSDCPIILLALLILTRLPLWMEQLLRFSGGFFVLYLAVGAATAWRTYHARGALQDQSSRQSLVKATMINLLNPNPYLSWTLVLGPLLLKGWREAPSNAVALLVSFYGMMILAMVVIVALFSAAGNLGPKVNRSLIGVSAIALTCFGIYQLWLGLTSYW